MPIRLPFLLFSLLVALCASGQTSGGPSFFEWSRATDIPDREGFAGSYAGVSGGALIVAGGARFEGGIRPWNGGIKTWDDAIFALEEPNGEWKRVGKLPRPLGYGISVSVPEGVLCIGGGDARQHYSDVFILRYAGGQMTRKALAPLPGSLANACGAIAAGRVYVAGGIDAPGGITRSHFWSLDISDSTATWEIHDPLPGGHRMLAMAGSVDGRFYLFGGVRLLPQPGAGGLKRSYLSDAWVFDPVKGWKPLTDMPAPRAAAPSPAWKAGQSHLLLFGGDDGSLADSTNVLRDSHPGFRPEILSYATLTDRWSEMGSMPVERRPDAAIHPHGSVYAPVTTPLVEWEGRVVIPGGEARPAVRTNQVLMAVPKRTAGKFAGIDWMVILAYFVVVAGISVVVSRRMRQTTGDFFLGGQQIPWWAAGLSIFGSKLSALTFIAIPAKAYGANWLFIFNNVMILVVAPIVAYYYLPYFRKLGITSVYEYLQIRFDRRVKLIGSLTFTIFQLSRLGVVIYLPALVLSTVTGIDIYLCILLTTVVTTAYSVAGGIEAVVWTEVMQVFVLLGGALASLLFIAAQADGGFAGMYREAMAHDKLRIAQLGWSMSEPVLWVVLLGSFLTNLITYTSDQVVVQRYLTTATEQEARRSIYTNAFMAIPATLIFFSVGTALWIFYRQHPAAMDPHGRNDDVFPWFIAQQLPPGLSGLVIAGLFAATMATISSSMNSIATVVTTDFFQLWKPGSTDRQRLRFARWLTVVLGFAGSLIAAYLVRVNNASIFDQYLRIIGLFGGALAGIFVAGIFLPRIDSRSITAGFLTSCVVLYFVQQSKEINFFLYPVFAVLGCVGAGWVFARLFPPANRGSEPAAGERHAAPDSQPKHHL